MYNNTNVQCTYLFQEGSSFIKDRTVILICELNMKTEILQAVHQYSLKYKHWWENDEIRILYSWRRLITAVYFHVTRQATPMPEYFFTHQAFQVTFSVVNIYACL